MKMHSLETRLFSVLTEAASLPYMPSQAGLCLTTLLLGGGPSMNWGQSGQLAVSHPR